MQKIVVIVGPTASGKSVLAVELAREFDGEVISADSRQVYRGLDIGTGKITKREMKGVPHHLLDVASPRSTFTAAQFAEKARAAITTINRSGHLPIVAGGTGFYIDALLGKVQMPEAPPNPRLRRELSEKSLPELVSTLQKLDPVRAVTIDRKNPPRLIRAIEIATTLGSVPPTTQGSPVYDVLWIGVAWPDDVLRERIRVRLHERMRGGMVTEIERLHEQGLSWKRMEELGLEYRYLSRCLRGLISKEQMLEELEREIWKYAKRQKTYWKRNKDIQWFKPTEEKKIEKKVKAFLTN